VISIEEVMVALATLTDAMALFAGTVDAGLPL